MKASFLKKPTQNSAPWRLSVVFRLALGLLFGLTPLLAGGGTASAARPVSSPIPTLAYYYIWFDVKSWDRAKTDYPLLGHYSSDDESVMRQHIQWAKAAGIQGFIVSWKSTDALNRRLAQLVDIAEQEDFKLALIYQGLDFDRNPLPVDKIDSDLSFFAQHYAGRVPFDIFGKPLVIWSGTWKFSEQDIARVSANQRKDMLLLATERNLKGYQRLAGLVDGDAYYWSSVNPETFPDYPAKLAGMSEEVHKNGGLWIPPAAPGFDARLIGGTSIVERKDGDTLRTQISNALSSSPDALGLISWNEFSENSYVEPSVAYGSKYLQVLSEINHLPAPQIGEFDSSEPAPANPASRSGLLPEGMSTSKKIAIGAVILLSLAALAVIARRSFRRDVS